MPDLDCRPLCLWYDNDDQDREDDSGTKENEVPKLVRGSSQEVGEEMRWENTSMATRLTARHALPHFTRQNYVGRSSWERMLNS